MKLFKKINWQVLAVIIIAALAVWTRFYQLDTIPAPWHLDEAGMAYDAYGLAYWRVNRQMMHLPVYLLNYGDGQSVLYAYTTAVLIKIFGDITPLVARLPAALLSLTIVVFASLFIRKASGGGKRVALLAAFLLTIFPQFIMQGRFALDCNLFLGMSVLATYSTLLAISAQKRWHWVVAGVIWGITLYSYALSWIVVPIFLLFLLIYLFYLKKISLAKLLCLVLPILVIGLPLIIFVVIEFFDLPPVFSHFYYIPRLTGSRMSSFELLNLVNFLKLPRLLFWVQDGEAYLPYPTFYWISVPLALSGMYLAGKDFWLKLRKKKFVASAIPIFFFVANLVQVAINSAHSNDTHHINSVFWPMAFFIVWAIIHFYRRLVSAKKKQLFLAVLLVIYSSGFLIFVYQYFLIFPRVPTYQKSFMYSQTPNVALAQLDAWAREHGVEEIVAEKTIWIDIPRYVLYYLGAKTPIPEMDLTSDVMNEVRFGNLRFSFMPGRDHCPGSGFCPVEIEQQDIYIVNSRETEYRNKLLSLGMKEIYRDNAFSILLLESEFEATSSEKLID